MNHQVAKFDRRLIVVLALGALIFLITWASTLRDRGNGQSQQAYQTRRLAPAFRLYDQNSELVNLSAYLNRHKVILVFFNGNKSPLEDSVMKSVFENWQQLATSDYQVFGISTALPQHNRAAVADDFPFSLLSDPAAVQPDSAHRTWGCLQVPNSQNPEASTIPKVFVIDRLGRVNWEGKYPAAVNSSDDFAQRLLNGEFD